MKLSSRISLVTVLGFGVLITSLQTVQFATSHRLVAEMGESALQLQRAREIETAENLNTALQFGIGKYLEAGEMDGFEKVVKLKQRMPALHEFTLYDSDGIACNSSDPGALRRKLPDALRPKLLGGPVTLTQTNAQFIEVYQSQMVEKTCLQCHETWTVGAVGGVTQLRCTTEALARMAAQAQAGTAHATRESLWASLGILLGLVAGAGALAYWIHLRVAKPLQALGDELWSGSTETKTNADLVASASQRLAESASEQAASLEEASAALAEMSAMTQRNASHAEAAKTLAVTARQSAERGEGDMTRMTTAMDEVKAASDSISRIIRTIDEIAFQTNILALNAAVEAARAGDAGMGFAVVADEVRNLAQRSAEAARETARQIEDCIAKSARGLDLSRKVSVVLGEIVTQVREVDELVGQITQASGEQNLGIGQITETVSVMDRNTQNSAAGAEETASAAKELDAEAQSLRVAVGELMRLLEGGPAPADAATVPEPARREAEPPNPRKGRSPTRLPNRLEKVPVEAVESLVDTPD